MEDTTSKFKYHLNHFIGKLPKSMKMETILHILEKEHGISRDTFYRDRNILKSDSFSIPSERLDVYAGLLDVPTDALKNYSVKVKSLAKRRPSTFIKKIGLSSISKKKSRK